MTHQDDEDPVQLEALLGVVRQRIEEATHGPTRSPRRRGCGTRTRSTRATTAGDARAHVRGSAVPLTLQVLLDTYSST